MALDASPRSSLSGQRSHVSSIPMSPSTMPSSILTPSPICSKSYPTRSKRLRAASSVSSHLETELGWHNAAKSLRMSHTSSLSWTSEMQKGIDDINKKSDAKYAALSRMFPHLPRDLGIRDEWLFIQQDIMDRKKAALEKRLRRMEERKLPHTLLFGGKEFADGKASVLVIPTMWCRSYGFHHPDRYGGTVWPSREEFIFEGDDRNKTRYGRFLPIPRAWRYDNRTVNFKVMRELPFMEFDRVGAPPSEEEMYVYDPPRDEFPPFDIDESVMATLLSEDVIAALSDDKNWFR